MNEGKGYKIQSSKNTKYNLQLIHTFICMVNCAENSKLFSKD